MKFYKDLCHVSVCLCVGEISVPLSGREVSGTLRAIPGAVRITCQAALGASLAVHIAAVQGHLGDPDRGSEIELLLWTRSRDSHETIMSY